MIKEDYVSFEVAKLLKEKKFPRFICHKHYADGEGVWVGNFNKPTPDFKCGELVEVDCGVPTDGCEIDAPTLQMALKWLRDEKNIDIDIKACCGMLHIKVYVPCIHTYTRADKLHEDDDKVRWIQHNHFLRYEDDDSLLAACRDFDTYEEAVNAALLYVLENLI